MTNVKMIWLCSQVNFRKWLVNPRIYTLAVVIVAFLLYHTYTLSRFAAEQGVGMTPWIFPHLTTAPVLQVFACLTVLLFCDAPFKDRHMPFLIVRTGRRNWVIGQLLYIVLASLVYTAFIYLISVIVWLPNIEWSTDWGILIESLGANPGIAPQDVTVFVYGELLSTFSAIEATLLSFGMFWLVSVFIGVLIFCFHILLEKMSGIIAAGVFIFLSFFSMVHGLIMLGDWLVYVSPISWMNLSSMDFGWSGTIADLPSPTYAITVLVGSSLIMSVMSIIVFCKKDIDIQDWGY